MSKRADRLYDIGDLKNDPEALYDLAVNFLLSLNAEQIGKQLRFGTYSRK